MTSIIIGTNKENSKSAIIAQFISEEMEDAQILDLSEISSEFIYASMYREQHATISELQDRYLIGVDKVIFIMPEYNGTFPGFLKLFIDACSVRNYQQTFKGKKLCLIGVGSGRGGNLRGLDHFTTAMNYMGCIIYPNRMAISKIDSVIVDQIITSDEIKESLRQLITEFSAF